MPWLVSCQRRDSSRSLLLLLQQGCPPNLWQSALESLGWHLEAADTSSGAADSSRAGGSEAGRELGASLGNRFGGRIDWTASVDQHRLVPMSASKADPAGDSAARQEG